MLDVDESFPDRLRTLLAERELSQAELARRTDIGRSTLNKIVNGKRRPSTRELGAIAHELDIDLLELVGIASAQAALERRARESEARAEEAEFAQRAEHQRRLDAEAHAEKLARARETEADAASERIAALEAELAESVDARAKCELELVGVRKKLKEVEAELSLFKLIEDKYPEREPHFRRPRPAPVIVDPELEAIRAKSDFAGAIAGKATSLAVTAVVFNTLMKRR